MANRDEDFRDLLRALGDYPREVIAKAATLAASGAISGHEKVALRARWLLELAELRASLRGPARDHATWRAVAGAPPGFCQIRQGLLGMFLDDVAAGKDNAAISRAMAAATGITYQRAQTAPAAQTIERAETLVEQLGLAPSLQRRFARLEEVEALWRHEEPDRGRGQGGVFAHLTPRSAPPSNRVTLPPQTLTWTKFARTVLPLARSIDYLVPPQPRKYGAITTAVDPDAPPILQWDTVQRRNPFSYYTYEHPVPPHRWELTTGHRRVNAICLMPHQWGPDPDAFPNHGRGLFLLLEGARDLRCPELALFPSMLKSELNEVRSVIEAFSKRGTLGGVEQATACGLLLGDGGAWDVRLVVATADTVGEYKLDRLD